MKYHTFIFALGIFLFTIGVSFATFRLELRPCRSALKIQPGTDLFIPFTVLLMMCGNGSIPTVSAFILLCAVGGWSVAQVIYALVRGEVRRFKRNLATSPADSGYCLRAEEPVWFWYLISDYALQACMAFVLPVSVFYKVMP